MKERAIGELTEGKRVRHQKRGRDRLVKRVRAQLGAKRRKVKMGGQFSLEQDAMVESKGQRFEETNQQNGRENNMLSKAGFCLFICCEW